MEFDAWNEEAFSRFSHPFPYAVHPDVDAIAAHLDTWSAGIGDETNTLVAQQQIASLAAYLYPRAQRQPLDPILLLAVMVAWMTSYDEAGFEVPSLRGDIGRTAGNLLWAQEISEDPDAELPADTDPYLHAWRRAQLDLRRLASGSQVLRFNHGLTRLFAACGAESLYITAGVMPRSREMLILRRIASAIGTHGCSTLLEVGGGYELPEATWSHPDLMRLGRLSDDITRYFNDGMALPRDLQLSHVPMNVGVAIAREDNLGPDQALDRLVTLHRERLDEFRRLTTTLRRTAGIELRTYLTDLEFLISGHEYWYRTTNRYHGTEEFAEG
ncbi:terpene synthase family protein [Kitasatospora sp. NPDC001574]